MNVAYFAFKDIADTVNKINNELMFFLTKSEKVLLYALFYYLVVERILLQIGITSLYMSNYFIKFTEILFTIV